MHPTTEKRLTLADARDGEWLIVVGCDSDDIKWQALRFGIGEGSLIQVQKNIVRGPVIISRKQIEIAIGRDIACSVSVRPADNQRMER
ncbi:MAG: ferrous iron transport protein A [Cyanobacteria bacterium]|nr:ferrous iron transport protein A [Cyanobacteriota bacterium]